MISKNINDIYLRVTPGSWYLTKISKTLTCFHSTIRSVSPQAWNCSSSNSVPNVLGHRNSQGLSPRAQALNRKSENCTLSDTVLEIRNRYALDQDKTWNSISSKLNNKLPVFKIQGIHPNSGYSDVVTSESRTNRKNQKPTKTYTIRSVSAPGQACNNSPPSTLERTGFTKSRKRKVCIPSHPSFCSISRSFPNSFENLTQALLHFPH